MRRERALKIVLVGLLFLALVYPLMMFVRQEPALAMMLSVYVTLGIFLLLAARNPSANRILIAFTAWSSFAHAGLPGEHRAFTASCSSWVSISRKGVSRDGSGDEKNDQTAHRRMVAAGRRTGEPEESWEK